MAFIMRIICNEWMDSRSFACTVLFFIFMGGTQLTTKWNDHIAFSVIYSRGVATFTCVIPIIICLDPLFCVCTGSPVIQITVLKKIIIFE